MIDKDFPLISTTRFNASNYGGLNPSTFSDVPLYTVHGIQSSGLEYPKGTSQNVTYQYIQANGSGVEASAISSSVQAFFPDFLCEPAMVNHTYPNTVSYSNFLQNMSMTFRNDWCTIGGNENPVPVPLGIDCLIEKVKCSASAGVFGGWGMGCDEGFVNSSKLIFVTNFAYDQQLVEGQNSIYNTSVTLVNISAVICVSSYSLVDSQIQVQGDSVTIDTPAIVSSPGVSASPLQNFSNADLLSAFEGSLSTVNNMFPDDVIALKVGTDTTSDFNANDMFYLMLEAIGSSNISSLLDPNQLASATQSIFKGLTVQYARQNLLVPASDSLIGRRSYSENRLHVRGLTVWLMGVSLILLTGLCMLVILLRPRDVVSKDPDSILAMCTLLASSKGLGQALRSTGHLARADLKRRFFTSSYQTRLGSTSDKATSFSLEPRHSARLGPDSSNVPSANQKFEYWRPLSIRRPIIVLTFALPLLLVATLEALQYVSNKNNGITSVNGISSDGYQVLASYFPAAIMLLVALLIKSFDFTVLTLTPYSALSRGPVLATRSIARNALGKLPLMALFLSLKRRHVGAALSTTAASVASFLTIVVSGLYTIEVVPQSVQFSTSRADQFNTSWSNSSNNDSFAGISA